jgi:oligopeptide transport system substrate-binding protein
MRKLSIKRILALALVCVMVLSVAGCGGGAADPDTSTSPSGTVPVVSPGVTTDVTTEALSYTFYDYTAASPNTWNAHEWESNEDSYIMDYTTLGLYDFILNDTLDGYEIIPEMAAENPVDVTGDYAGNDTYGVPADATSGYAFKIALNELATWEDGTPINADTYLYSMEQMLSSEMKNYRANSYYSGQLTLANSYSFYMQDQVGAPSYSTIGSAGYDTIADAQAAGITEFYVDMANFWGMADAGWQSITDETEYVDPAVPDETDPEHAVSGKYLYDSYLAAGAAYESYQGDYIGYVTSVIEETTFDQVGLIKTGDYEITIVLERPITDFYLKYNLSTNWIVYKDLYEAGKSDFGGLTKTNYGTAVDNYMSFGPYKLTEYQTDKVITMEKNDAWYGYTDGKHVDQFQTTRLECQIVEEQATAMLLFLQGKLDGVSLTAEDMESYRTSDYVLYTPESYTSKLTFNSDYTALKERESAGINKTILSNIDFRHAISLCIDRTDFCAQCTATHSAGYGLINYMYVYDPETGSLYRDTDAAASTLCTLYGVDSEDQITGYDLDASKALFQAAYDAAVAAGDINETDTVELEFLTYTSDDSYVKMVNFIQSAIDAGTAGTSLEGKVKIKQTADADYYDHAQQGAFEIIISTWGGASMDPFGILECYVSPEMKHEYGFDSTTETLTLTVDGTEYTYTYYEWYDELCNKTWALADLDVRLDILAKVELALLQTYNTTPIYYRTSASLQSRKVIYPTEEYVQLVVYGGFRFMTYAYDDAAWAEYCAQNNNQLTY